MDRNRWNTVNRIFHAALEVDPGQRRSLVATESNGDLELQAEVESLLQADADVGSYLEAPLASAQLFAFRPVPLGPGDVLCNRFRIVREIAEGGMGRVFEAFDSELAVHVALKVIRPDVASNPEIIARFLQEVRLARTITHPNICRTFDLERDTRTVDGRTIETLFLTMEFLAGETLSSRINRLGGLPFSESLDLARQIADALHSAHRLGITHRDMKPANIMLVKEASSKTSRAVITDFGLARLDPSLREKTLSGLTQTGLPIGTLAYMAPEQLDGSGNTSATDIYAFGLILFEMVAGKRAFPSDNPLSGIAQRLHGTLSLDALLPAETPESWRCAIRQCLALKPVDRPIDAQQVIGIIEGAYAKITWRFLKVKSSQRLRWPGAVAMLIAFIGAMALFASGMRLYTTRESSRIPPGSLVYLTPVLNQTGETSLDGVTELIEAGLSQSVQVNLLDRARVGDILQQMTKSPEAQKDASTAREIAMRAGVPRVVFATVTGSHGAYSLNVEIQQPDNNPARYRERWSKSFMWRSTELPGSPAIPAALLTSVRSASDWIRHEAGESVADIARLDEAPQDVTTDNWEALGEYARAQQLASRGFDETATVALRHAVNLDPGFALAYARLGDILVSEEHTSQGFEAYSHALDTSNERRLSRRERDRIQGMYAYDSGDIRAADIAFRDYVGFYENDPNGWAYRVGPLIDLGRTDEAIASLHRLIQLKPESEFGMTELISCFLLQGKYDEARQWIERLRQAGYADKALKLEGTRQFLIADFVGAENSFINLSRSSVLTVQRQSLPLLARLYAERGDYRQALSALDAAIHETASSTDAGRSSALLMDRAAVLAKLGDDQAMLQDIREALNRNVRAESLMQAASLLGDAFVAAQPARRSSLRVELKKLQQLMPPGGGEPSANFLRMRLQIELCRMDADWKGSLIAANRSSTLDAPSGSRAYLGRALVAAALHQRNPESRLRLERQAMQAYGIVALQPGVLWRHPLAALPGDYADQLSEFTRLAASTATRTLETQRAAEALSRLRSSEPHPTSGS